MTEIVARLKAVDVEYRGDYDRYLFSMLNGPGQLYGALLSRLEPFGVELEDLRIEGDGPSGRRVICELPDHNGMARVGVAALEIEFQGLADAGLAVAPMILKATWAALSQVEPPVFPKLHRLTLNFDCALEKDTYQSVLERFVVRPRSLPDGTETAVVYYLPDDAVAGLADSSIVLNRSETPGAQLLISLSASYNAASLLPEQIIPLGESRLLELTSQLELALEWKS